MEVPFQWSRQSGRGCARTRRPGPAFGATRPARRFRRQLQLRRKSQASRLPRRRAGGAGMVRFMGNHAPGDGRARSQRGGCPFCAARAGDSWSLYVFARGAASPVPSTFLKMLSALTGVAQPSPRRQPRNVIATTSLSRVGSDAISLLKHQERFFAYAKPCKNSVHGSTGSPRTDLGSHPARQAACPFVLRLP